MLHQTVQSLDTGVAVVDRAGDVVISNPRAHELGIVHERALDPQAFDVVTDVLDDGEARDFSLTNPKQRSGKRVIVVGAHARPLGASDRRLAVVFADDDSEQVRMEAARRDFVANVSHELKTPVGAMALLAEALVESRDDPEAVEHFGNRVIGESHRLANMIAELISLSKLQGAEKLPDLQVVHVDQVIAAAIARCTLAAENAKITLHADEPSGLLVAGDQSLLVTAVSNLVGNAINYSSQSTPVTITHRKVDGKVQIRVTDRGIGIAPDMQERVFERFFRVDSARSRATGGTGLGLAIVKHVAANHGGTIALWSQPGTGSTFTLELPLIDESATAESAKIEATPTTKSVRLSGLNGKRD